MDAPPGPDAADSKLQYLHCNRCGFSAHGVDVSIDASHDPLLDIRSNRSVYVAQCSHVICCVCLGLTRNNQLNQLDEPSDPSAIPAAQCPVCQTTCALVRVDPAAMPDDIKLIISPFIEALENALEVAKFQYGNATSLIKFLKHSNDPQIAQMKAAIKTHVENSRSQNIRIKNLEEELAASKIDVKQLKQQLANNKQQLRSNNTTTLKSQFQHSRQPAQQPLFNFQYQNDQQIQQPSLQYQKQQQYRHQSSEPQQTPFISSPTQPQQQKSQVLHTPMSPSRLSLQPQTHNHQQQQQQRVSSVNSNSSMLSNQSFELASSSLSKTAYASNSMASIDVAGFLAYSPTRQFQRARPETASGGFASPKYASTPSKPSNPNRNIPQYTRQSAMTVTTATAAVGGGSNTAQMRQHQQHQQPNVNYVFDDAETFQQQKQIRQQQQMQQIQHQQQIQHSGRPASMVTGGFRSAWRSGSIASLHNGFRESIARNSDGGGRGEREYDAGVTGKTMLNRQSFGRGAGNLGNKQFEKKK
ncbi:hypothetical protein HK100_012010 [Physocladia obscura]|uniref:RING-type domain-containing protein n=1 Tax=Physocladia obscura TaxID=109957 RepID=A0AAD5T239_9FUNG|nr:hypothetical protein HK100_012010 [Physocladia obscura]